MHRFHDSDFVRIAHRGASGHVPENTLEAFQRAVELGTDALHLDVCLTADRQLVISHDINIGRTTNGQGSITKMTLAELQALDAGWHSDHLGEKYRGKGYRIPTLEEVLELDDGLLGWCFDIKDRRSECATALVTQLEERGLTDRLLVSCASDEVIDCIRAHRPEFATALSRTEIVEFYRCLWAPGDGLNGYQPVEHAVLQIPEYAAAPDNGERFYLPTEGAIEAAHELGMPVFVATVDNEDAMASLRRVGVDGIHTDFPDRLNRVLRMEAVEQT